jgi:hypothetical protein
MRISLRVKNIERDFAPCLHQCPKNDTLERP